MKIKSILLIFIFSIPLFIANCSGGSTSSTATPGDENDNDGAATETDGPTGTPYDMGSYTVSDLYVSITGNDSNSGKTLAEPLRTLDAAWDKIPASLTTTGYRINLLPGEHPCGADEGSCINFFDEKAGTQDCPVIIRSVDASGAYSAGAALIRGGMDIFNVSHLYLLGVAMAAGGTYPSNNSFNNVLHLSQCDHVLMRDMRITGPAGRTDTTSTIQEVIKANQCTDLYLENSDVSGSFQTVVDYFSVQGGHFLNSQIHGSGGRGAYLKGGSAYFRIEGNEFYDCVEAGFQAGEGSNLNLMQKPWIHYEAYDIKVINNIVHDIHGAGLSVSGGYNILMAYNTLYRIGLRDDSGRDWTLAQFVLGSRSCPVVDEYPSAALACARCQELIDDGGWGAADAFGGGEWIPNKNIYVYNNIFYNPTGVSTTYSHFAVNGELALPADAMNLPNPARTDENLVIRGNIIWNGNGLDLIGTTNGSANGCNNATCSEAQLHADNAINTIKPELTDPAAGDFRPRAASNVLSATAYAIPDFAWDTWPDGSNVPTGTLSNSVTENRSGAARSGADHPGAY